MSPAGIVAFAGTATALVSILLAGIAGGPYLDSEHLNGWVVVFAAGLLAALVAVPMVMEARFRARRGGGEEGIRNERWESAALAWGGITLAVLAVVIPVGIAESFSGSSLAGTLALLATIEAALVLLALLAWVLAD